MGGGGGAGGYNSSGGGGSSFINSTGTNNIYTYVYPPGTTPGGGGVGTNGNATAGVTGNVVITYSSTQPIPTETWSVLGTITFNNLSIADEATTTPIVISTISTQLSVPSSSITILSVVEGSLIYTTQIINYNSNANASQGSVLFNAITFPPSDNLGPTTIISSVLPPVVPSSNICFPAGTPIKTDQGFIAIELLDTNKHTIDSQPIMYITKTTTMDKYLDCFDKDSLLHNYPNKKTIMTKDHLLEYEGRMVPADRFLRLSKGVKKVNYTGEVLYNVLLAEYGTMRVNNLICETLHPENIIAKLYTNNYTGEERTDIIIQLNESLEKKEYVKYKNVVNKLSGL